MDYVHSGALGEIRTVKAWAYMDWIKSIAKKSDAGTKRRRLRYVARAGAAACVQPKSIALQLPLVLGLRRRLDDGLGSASHRHRRLGYANKVPTQSHVVWRQFRISQQCYGNAGHAASHL